MSNIEHKDVGVSSLKGTPSKKIYIKTSTEAVYNPEGVTQEYINNHVDGSKIVDGTITTGKIVDNAVTMGKLDNEVQTLIQQGADSSWTPKGDFNIETTYDANDVVFDPVTNSSYLSLRADNTGHPVDENDEEYEEGWWMKVLDGSYVNRAIEEMEAAIAQAIEDAQEDIDDAIAGANTAAQSANTAATNAENKIAWVEEQVESLVAYEVDDELDEESIIPVQNKVVTEKIKEIDAKYSPLVVVTSDNIQYPSSTIVGVTMSGGVWTEQAQRQLYIMPYTYQEWDVLHMLANAKQPSSYAFLTSDTHTAGSAVPFCDPTTQAWTYIEANTIADIPIPSNCQYIAINAYYGLTQNKTSFMPQLLQVVHNYVPAMKGILDSIDGKVDKVIIQDSYDLNNVAEKDCLPADVNWYKSGNNGKHKAISAIVGGYYRVNKNVYISWLTSAYTGTATNGQPVPYVSGTKREWTLANTIVQAPQATAYLCITTVDGAGGVYTDLVVEKIEPQEKDILYSKDLIGEPNENNVIVDLTSYTPQAGVLLEDGSGWYKVAGYTHIAVPVVAGERYTIKAGDAGWFAYGLFKTYSGSNVTPDLCASAKKRFNRQGVVIVDIPSDCTYIVFSATSNYVNTLPSLMCKMKLLSWAASQMASPRELTPMKLRYAHWNVGHFSYYDKTLGGHETTITAEASPTMQKRYKEMINKVSPDIFGICEYNPEFDLGGNLTKDVILQNYKYQVIGTKRYYSCDSVFGNVMLTPVSEVLYTHRAQDMYYKAVKAIISGIEVYIVETHLDWENEEPEGQPTTNTLQQQQLIAAFANYDHVILSGDFNVNYIEQYQLFVDAGYTLVSGSYLDYDTYLRYAEGGQPDRGYLDNIMVKGFAVSNRKAWDESGWSDGGLSDHSILSCDLLIIP